MSSIETKWESGQRVAYEDMANPLREGSIVCVQSSPWGIQYGVQFDNGDFTMSDMRQRGWKAVAEAETHSLV